VKRSLRIRKTDGLAQVRIWPLPEQRPPDIEVWFDGACGPRNPGGRMGMGVLIRRGGEVLAKEQQELPAAPGNTNNVAEYLALTRALEILIAAGLTGETILVRGDSNLVIHQMFGNARGRRWKIKGGAYAETALRARALLGDFRAISGEWVPRHLNAHADALSKGEPP